MTKMAAIVLGFVSSRHFCLLLLCYLLFHGNFRSKSTLTTNVSPFDLICVSNVENRPKLDTFSCSRIRNTTKEQKPSLSTKIILGSCYFHLSSTAILLIFLSNDVSPNPGPNTLHLSAKDITHSRGLKV